MKIEVWSDFVCPFCYIGKRRLEEALQNFAHRDEVEVEFKSFELDPNAAEYNGKSIHQAIADKYNIPLDQAKQANANIIEQAATVGLDFRFEEMKPTNTFVAHRLAKYAKSMNKDTELTEKLLHSYFTDNVNLSNHETLVSLAEDVGLDRNKAIEVLHDDSAYAEAVRADESLAQSYGVTGVPFFVINSKYAISGAQPLETFTGAIEKVWEEEKPKFQDLSSIDAGMCTDDSCTI
ncbi:DsbA family oxidoreductase [Paraliobacillus ryukyuensis]|uniref:DsbA family oxidoreductase n=1 Tax=Paraliobacillus ryukyuensis TaxID=200904 RepID=UPI0009A6C85D|nr:DsbA family oxidoreductase [Paraliobacillus ryukyuensis]